MNDQNAANKFPKVLLDVNDVMALTGLKQCSAYKIIRQCNEELRQMNKIVVRGKVNRKYLLQKLDVVGV